MPIRVLVLLAIVTASLGWANKSLCVSHGYTHEYQYSRLCYTDVYALWYDEGLSRGKVPILDNETPSPAAGGKVHSKYVEYPVVIGGLMAGAEGLAHTLVRPTTGEQLALAGTDATARTSAQSHLDNRRARVFFDATAAFLVVCAALVVVLTGLTAGRRRIWDAALVAVAPALLLHADVNWDLAAVAFTAGALFAWSRRAPAVAGMLLGFGVATKFYPLLLIVPLFALCLRAGQLRSYARLVGAAVLAWVVVDLPVWIAAPAGFGRFYAFSRDRGTEYNSLFYAFSYAVFGKSHSWDPGHKTPTWLNFWGALLLGLLLLGLLALIMLAPRRPRLGQVAFLTVLAFVITNKVYSPQYVLWLLPLVALARPRWRYFLAWQFTEVVLLILLYAQLIFTDTSGNRGIGYAWFFFLGDLPRDAVLLGLAGLVVREAIRPELDVVRDGGQDDPAGGVLDEAPDRLVLVLGGSADAPDPEGDVLVGAGSPTPGAGPGAAAER